MLKVLHKLVLLLMLSGVLIMSLPKHWLHDCAQTHASTQIHKGKKNPAAFSHNCSICDLDHQVYTPGIQLQLAFFDFGHTTFTYSDTYCATLRTFDSEAYGRGPPTV